MLRTEPRNRNNDQAPTAILELVDGPRDMRFAMTAKTVMRERELEGGVRDITLRNIAKVTRFREGGEEALHKMIRTMETAEGLGGRENERGGREMGERRAEGEHGSDRTRSSRTRSVSAG